MHTADKPSAVIWDMGGVMYRYFTELLVDLGTARGWPLERLPLGPSGPSPDPFYEAMDRGKLTEPEYVAQVRAALFREHIDFSPHADLDFRGAERPETWSAVEQVQSAGLRQAVLTNDATLWLGERWWETWKPYRLFDAVIDVAALGVRKPAPEPYLACARALGLPPAECLFIDDMHANCSGAEAVGMQSHWFDITAPARSAGALMDRLGV